MSVTWSIRHEILGVCARLNSKNVEGHGRGVVEVNVRAFAWRH